MSLFKEFSKGIIKENPTLVLLIGMCPPLAVTSSAINGLGMGVATTFVLVCSNMVIAALKNVIPDKVRLPAFIVIIATFVTIVDLAMKAYTPALSESLGVFIPLIVVNCIILGRAEAFAQKNGVLSSMFDGLGMGLGFTLSLTVLGTIREVLGNGSIFDFKFVSEETTTILLFVLAPGAFIMLGLMVATMNKIMKKG
ncbi:MAG: RnfABCDGE type electron transport complex subunit E [bacterium]